MNADLSVAPEIAQLAMPLVHVPPPAAHASKTDVTGRPATTGQLATALSRLAAAPQRWWDLVRFDPDGPARIDVPAPFEAWLLVVPPGHTATCDCDLATLVAGEVAEDGAALRPGRVRVHGTLLAGKAVPGGQHAVASLGRGYSVSLHASA